MEEESILDREVKLEEDEEEFRSCCEDEDEFEEIEELPKECLKDTLDDASVNMFFKGVSIAQVGEGGDGLSGIGVVMERSANSPFIQVQKKLDFFVDESVAEYFSLMDGLFEASQNGVKRVFAFTDSKSLHDQIVNMETPENPLILALRQRVLERAESFEAFELNLVPQIDLIRPLILAKVAIGVVSLPPEGKISSENCSICCEDKPAEMMVKTKCSHKFCSQCMKAYVDGKVQAHQVPITCPQLKCRHCISNAEFKSFLPVASYDTLEKAFAEANFVNSDKMYCPYSNCSFLLDPRECISVRGSCLSQSDNTLAECPSCRRFICVECGVPWHSSMSCEEYQDLPLEEREGEDASLHCLAENRRWRRCEQCRLMIELSHGCNHMACRCGHEFCYSCGASYRNGQQACACTLWDEEQEHNEIITHTTPEAEQWAWDSFVSLPMNTDAYTDQERSQLALIQRFLAGGFGLSDYHPYQSPPPPRCTESYVDAMKDLHQLPWLERFVSVISDNYYDDYIQ